MVTSNQHDPGKSGLDFQLNGLLHAGAWAPAASATAAALTALVLSFDFPPSLVLSWAGLAAIAHAAAFGLRRAFRPASQPLSPKLEPPRSVLGAFAIGVAWGLLAMTVIAGASSSQVFIYAMEFAIMAGAVLALSDHPPALDAVIWSIAVLLALATSWLGDLTHLVLAVLLLLFAVAMTVLGRRLNRLGTAAAAAWRERGQMAAELALGNSRLAAAATELARVNQRLETANGDLVRAHAEAEAASRAKSEFLANMSHELRTPLNAIIGFAEVIESETFGPAGPRYREYASDIYGSGRHLLQVINDILDLAKVEAGQMLLHEARLDPALVMQGCVRLIKPRAAKSNVRIHTVFDSSLPVLLADEARLRQIALNLLSNAVKFTKAGGRVSISTGLDTAGGITIAVADSGIGMTADEIRIALEPFRQVTSSLSRTNEGTGLGLPLTKTLVELHGGELEIASAPGRGTTVTVRFPPSRSLARPVEAAVATA